MVPSATYTISHVALVPQPSDRWHDELRAAVPGDTNAIYTQCPALIVNSVAQRILSCNCAIDLIIVKLRQG